MRLFSLFLLLLSLAANAEDWLPYPDDLPQFDYSGDALAEHWLQLSAGPQLPFPDEPTIRELFSQYPALYEYSLTLTHQHPALQALADGDATPLAQAVQQIWRLHYSGHFQQAYELGMKLGPAGAVPALYAKNMYATLLVTEKDEKLSLFREAAAESEKLLPLTPDHPFARFGLAYSHARILELLDTGEATSSGYLSKTQDTLEELREMEPANALYPAVLGGIHAGVVDRVGSFIGRITYGSTATSAIESFDQALASQNKLPVIYNEYAKALGQMDASRYHGRRLELLRTCTTLPVLSAEEALNRVACSRQLKELQETH